MASYYKGLEFKTSLEAQWAAFFDLAGWSWWVNPRAIENWRPDFKVTLPCGHSQCGGSHTLLVSVLPISDVAAVKEHPCLRYSYKVKDKDGEWIADAGAIFGNDPTATIWEMSHGSGGGVESVMNWASMVDEHWIKAKSLIK